MGLLPLLGVCIQVLGNRHVGRHSVDAVQIEDWLIPEAHVIPEGQELLVQSVGQSLQDCLAIGRKGRLTLQDFPRPLQLPNHLTEPTPAEGVKRGTRCRNPKNASPQLSHGIKYKSTMEDAIDWAGVTSPWTVVSGLSPRGIRVALFNEVIEHLNQEQARVRCLVDDLFSYQRRFFVVRHENGAK